MYKRERKPNDVVDEALGSYLKGKKKLKERKKLAKKMGYSGRKLVERGSGPRTKKAKATIKQVEKEVAPAVEKVDEVVKPKVEIPEVPGAIKVRPQKETWRDLEEAIRGGQPGPVPALEEAIRAPKPDLTPEQKIAAIRSKMVNYPPPESPVETPPVVKPFDVADLAEKAYPATPGEEGSVVELAQKLEAVKQAELKARIDFNRARNRQIDRGMARNKEIEFINKYLTPEQVTDYETKLEKLDPLYPKFVNGKEVLSTRKEMAEARKLVKEMKEHVPKEELENWELGQYFLKKNPELWGDKTVGHYVGEAPYGEGAVPTGVPAWMINDPNAHKLWHDLAQAGGKSAGAISRVRGFIWKQIKKANPKTADEVSSLNIDSSLARNEKDITERMVLDWEHRVKSQYINRKIATGDFPAEEYRRLGKKPKKVKASIFRFGGESGMIHFPTLGDIRNATDNIVKTVKDIDIRKLMV